MSIVSSSSNVCRHLWIKRFCYDIITVQYRRSITTAAKQVDQATSISYSSTHISLPSSTHSTATTATKTKTTTKFRYSKEGNRKREQLNGIVLKHTKAGEFKIACRLISDFHDTGFNPDVKSYNHVIKGLAKEFQHDYNQQKAHDLIEEMTQRGIRPNSNTYMQMLLGYTIHTKNIISSSSSSSSTITLEILRKMKQLLHVLLKLEYQRGYKDTHNKIKKLMAIMASSGHPAILPTMMTISKAGIKLDIEIWNSSLRGCIKGGYFDAGEQLLDLMRTSLKQEQSLKQTNNDIIPIPSTTSYHILIEGNLRYGNKLDTSSYTVNMEKSIELFQKMMDDGIVADYLIYQSFIYAYTTLPDHISINHINNNNRKNKSNTENKYDQLDTVQKLWQAMIATLKVDHKLDDNFIATLVGYFLKNKEYTAAEEVYWDLRYHKYIISKNMVNYFDKVVIGSARKQHLLSAVAMFYDMLSLGYGIRNAPLIILLRESIARCQIDMAEKIIENTEEKIKKPLSIYQYTMTINGFVQQGQTETAKKIFHRLLQYYKQDQGSTLMLLSDAYTIMIQGLFKSNQINEAEALFHQYINLKPEILVDKNNNKIKGQHINEPHKLMINEMIKGYGLIGQDEKLNDFIHKYNVNKKSKKDLRILSTLIKAKLHYGDVSGADFHLENAMKHYDVSDLQPLVERLLASYALDGNINACEHWANVLKSRNVTSNLLYESLLTCYGQSGNFEKLKELYNQVNRDQKLKLEIGIHNKINNEWLKNCI